MIPLGNNIRNLACDLGTLTPTRRRLDIPIGTARHRIAILRCDKCVDVMSVRGHEFASATLRRHGESASVTVRNEGLS